MKPARPITKAMLAGVSARLFGRVEQSDGCMEWPGARYARGYGRISIGGQWWPTHRIAYALTKGIPSPGELVRHKCDNPPCINPDHLELGDDWLNAQDRKLRGREPDRRGQNNGRCRLTTDDVRAIRSSPLGYKRLARLYGVGRTTIRDARSGRNWSHAR